MSDFIPDDQFVPDGEKGIASAPLAGASPAFVPNHQFVSDEEKFGTPGQQVLTGIEGLAKGVAGPLATGAEAVLHQAGIPGLSPEEQRGRAEENPLIHGGAEAAGFAGSMLTGVGEAGLVAAAGEGAAKAAGLGLEGASTISKIASGGIKTGAEMAALQAGDEVSKQINQDPGASLGQAAINIGLSGILGGAGGAVLGAVSPLWKASMEKSGAPKILDDAKAQYEFRQNLPNGGDVPGTITDELNTRLAETDAIRGQMENLKGASLERAMPAVAPENTAKIDDQIQGISGQMAKNIEKAADNAYLKGAVPKLKQDFQEFLEVANNPTATYADKFDAINELKRSQQAKARYNLNAEDSALGAFTKTMARDLRLALEDTKVWGDAGDVQRQVNAATKASIDASDAAVGKFTSKNMNGIAADKDKITTLVNQSLKGKGANKAGVIGDYIKHTDNLADTINQIHVDAGLEAPIRMTPTPALDHTLGRSSPGTTLGNWLYDKGLASATGHVAGQGIGAGIGSLIGHPALGAIAGEKILAPALTSIAKPLLESASRSEAFKGSLEYITSVIKGDRTLNTAAQNFFKAGAEILPHNLIPNTASRDTLEKSLEYASNPNNAMNIGGGIGHYLPAHATTAASTAAAATNYFKTLKPIQIQKSPLDRPSPVDKNKLHQYQRALDIAQQPLITLKYAKEGTLQPGDVQALNTLYPALHSKIVTQVYDQMAKSIAEGRPVPYKQRLSLSLLMGKPLDSTMTQPAMQTIMLSNTPRGAPAQPQGNQQKKVPKSTASSMQKVNKMYATPGQSRAASRSES